MKPVSIFILVGTVLLGICEAGLTRIDSVTVDSVWNTDYFDQYGLPYNQRTVKLSFKPIATDTVICYPDLSFDSGKTWNFSRAFFDRIDSIGATKAAPNKKQTITLKLSCADSPAVVFRITARNDTVGLHDLRFSNYFGGWSELDSTYAYYHTGYELAGLIDGFYMPFLTNGMVEGYQSTLVRADSVNLVQNIMDFGTQTRATSIYNSQKPESNPIALAYPDSVASAQRHLGGVTAYAHFRHFYISLSFSGYSVQDSAVADANRLLSHYKQKIEK